MIKAIPFQIMKFNLISLYDKIRSMKDAIKFAQERNILKKSTKCKLAQEPAKINIMMQRIITNALDVINATLRRA